MRKTIIFVICFFALFFAYTSVQAYEIKSGSSVNVSKEEAVDGNLYAFGQSIVVDANVKGDVICAGQNISINGDVEGSVLCAGQSITVKGKIGGTAGLAAESVSIDASVARNLNAFAANLSFGENASTGWDLVIGAGKAEIRGEVGRDLYGGAGKVDLYGKVGRNVELDMGKSQDNQMLKVYGSADIGGKLDYTSDSDAKIEDGAKIAGDVTKKDPEVRSENAVTEWFRWKAYSIFAALIIGLVLVSIWRKPIERITDMMLERVGPAFGWGALLLFITPILAIALVIMIIGFPLAVILMSAWLVLVMISKVITGILVGRSLVERFWQTQKDSIVWAMIIGVIVVQAAISIPVIGWLLSLLAMLWGLGGIFIYFQKQTFK